MLSQHATVDAWGDSVLNGVLDAVMRVDTTAANVASLVFEAKINVIKIPDFMDKLRAGGSAYEQQVIRRFMLAAMSKGINGDLLLDASEEFEQKNASFGGLPEVMDRFMQLVSGASDVPMTRLFGMSPGGLNSTGESDDRSYYDRVAVTQALEIEPALSVLDECLIWSALGERPADLWYSWRPLWQPSAKERAEVGKLQMETLAVLQGMQAVSTEALGQTAVNALTESGAFPGLESAADEFPVTETDDPIEQGVMRPGDEPEDGEE